VKRVPAVARRSLLAAVLLLAACGETPPSAPPSALGVAGACSLVPDMDALIGLTAVAPPASYTSGSSDRCLWPYGNDPSRYVGVTVGPAALHGATIGVLGEGESVDGVGDGARWYATARTLSVQWGNRTLQVDFELADDAGSRELAVAIAERALAGGP
jgi:hypothetical protein